MLVMEMKNTSSMEQGVDSVIFIKWIVEGVALPVVGVAGIFGNCFFIAIAGLFYNVSPCRSINEF